MPKVFINIDVDDLEKGAAFYAAAVGLTPVRRLGDLGPDGPAGRSLRERLLPHHARQRGIRRDRDALRPPGHVTFEETQHDGHFTEND
jgi:hypothetical protein